MRRFRLPGTTLDVSRIGCGCMGLGGTWDDAPLTSADQVRAAAVLEAACEEGITLFDHADIYTRGKSEAVFGEVLAQVPGLRDLLVLQSKCGIRFADEPHAGAPGRYDFSYDHIVRSVEGSLTRLRTDRLDILLLHRPDPLMEPEEIARAFSDLERSGKVRAFGVSNFTAGQIAVLQPVVPQRLIVNQIELSLWHHGPIDGGLDFNRGDEVQSVAAATLDYCRHQQILVQAYSPLAKGQHLELPPGLDGRDAPLSDELRRLSDEHCVTPEAIAIAWLLRHPAGVQPIIGTRTPDRLRACCAADAVMLTREEWYALLVAARGAPLP